jgi:hypothetical protein
MLLDALYYEQEKIRILFTHFPRVASVGSEIPLLRTGNQVHKPSTVWINFVFEKVSTRSVTFLQKLKYICQNFL